MASAAKPWSGHSATPPRPTRSPPPTRTSARASATCSRPTWPRSPRRSLRVDQPEERTAIVRDHPVARNLVPHTGRYLHAHRDLRRLQRIADALRVLGDLVVLTGEQID